MAIVIQLVICELQLVETYHLFHPLGSSGRWVWMKMNSSEKKLIKSTKVYELRTYVTHLGGEFGSAFPATIHFELWNAYLYRLSSSRQKFEILLIMLELQLRITRPGIKSIRSMYSSRGSMPYNLTWKVGNIRLIFKMNYKIEHSWLNISFKLMKKILTFQLL